MQQIKCVRLVADIVVVCAKMDQKSTLGFSPDLIIHIRRHSPALSHAWQVKSNYIPIREKIQVYRMSHIADRFGLAVKGQRSGAERSFLFVPSLSQSCLDSTSPSMGR